MLLSCHPLNKTFIHAQAAHPVVTFTRSQLKGGKGYRNIPAVLLDMCQSEEERRARYMPYAGARWTRARIVVRDCLLQQGVLYSSVDYSGSEGMCLSPY
jgi:hypothetical protein